MMLVLIVHDITSFQIPFPLEDYTQTENVIVNRVPLKGVRYS